MRELFSEDVSEMPNSIDTAPLDAGIDVQQARESLEGKHVCPFCGTVNESQDGACSHCSLENTPSARKATKARIGPWYVLQRRNPAAPGMKYEMLLTFVKKGRVRAKSVVRGPTTHQFWRFAAHVKGLSREFGLCYSCGGKIERTASICPQCNRLQTPPPNPDVLLETSDPEPAPVFRQPKDVFNSPSDADIVIPALGPIDVPLESIGAPVDLPVTNGRPRAHAARAAGAESGARIVSLGPPIAAPSSPAPVLGVDPKLSSTGGRWRSVAEAMLFLAILISTLGLGVLYVNPELRQQAIAWVNKVMGTSKPGDTPPKSSAPPSAERTGAVPLQATGRTVEPPPVKIVPPVAKTVPLPAPAPTFPPPPEMKRISAPAPAPVAEIKPAPAPPPTPPKVVKAPENPEPVKPPVSKEPVRKTEDALPPAAAPELPPVDDETIARERALYRAALDAEGRGDFAEAVRSYEEIRKLPHRVWHTDVESRLNYDKALLGK